MPKILETDIGEIEFPDEFTVDQLNEWGRTELPRLRERVNKGVVSDLASRFPRDVAVAGADTIMGAARGWQQFLDAGKVSGIRQMGALAALEAPVGEENAAIEAANAAADAKAKELEATREQRLAANPVYKFGEDSKKNALEFYQTNPTREGSIPAMLSQGVASTVPMIAAAATGPVAPLAAGVTYGAMAGQQGAMEAIAMGHPDKADEAFLLFAGLGALSEAALGYPIAFLRKVAQARRAGVDPAAFGRTVRESLPLIGKRTAREALEGFGRESLQEGTEQTGQNVVASDIVGYDPDRPLMQNVPQSAAIGGVVGAGVGGAGGAAMAIDEARARARVPAMLQATIETPATPEQRAAEAAGLPIPLVSPTQLSAEQSAAEQAAIVADIQRRMGVPPADFTAPEMADQPRPFAPAPPAAEPPRFQPPTPAQPAEPRRRSPAPQPESERHRFRPPPADLETISPTAKSEPLTGPPEATTPVVPEALQKGVAPTPQPQDPNAIPIGSSATLPVQAPPEARPQVVQEVRQPERPAETQTETPQAERTLKGETLEQIAQRLAASSPFANPKNRSMRQLALPRRVAMDRVAKQLRAEGVSQDEADAFVDVLRKRIFTLVSESANIVRGTAQTAPQVEAKAQTEVQAVAQVQGPRAAKEIKSELVTRLEEAMAAAPSLKDVSVSLWSEWNDGAKKGRTREAFAKSAEGKLEKISIHIPGDGTFTIWNSKETLEEVLTRAKRLDTSKTEGPRYKRPYPSGENPELSAEGAKRARGTYEYYRDALQGVNPIFTLNEFRSVKQTLENVFGSYSDWHDKTVRELIDEVRYKLAVAKGEALSREDEARIKRWQDEIDYLKKVSGAENKKVIATRERQIRDVRREGKKAEPKGYIESIANQLESLERRYANWNPDTNLRRVVDAMGDASGETQVGTYLRRLKDRAEQLERLYSDEQTDAKYSVTLQDAPASQVTAEDIQRAFPAEQGFVVKPVGITMNERDGSTTQSTGYLVTLPNRQAILIDPNREVINFDPNKAAADWGIDPQLLAERGGIARGVFYPNGVSIEGLSQVGLIELIRTADASTLSHEKFHALFSMALTPDERTAILNRYQTEEKAAEAFRRSEGFTRGFWEKMRRFIEWLANLVRGDAFRKLRAPLSAEPSQPTGRTEPQYSIETIYESKQNLEDYVLKAFVSPETALDLRDVAGAQAALVPDSIADEIKALDPNDPVEKRMVPLLDFVVKLHGVAPALELRRILNGELPEDVKQAAISAVLKQIEHVRVKTNELEDKLQEANKKLANALKQGGKITKEKLVEARAKQIADNLITGYRAYLTAQAANLPANQNLAAARMELIQGMRARLDRNQTQSPDSMWKALERIAERISELPVSEGPIAVTEAIRQKGILRDVAGDPTIDLLTAEKPGGLAPLLASPEAGAMLQELAALQKKSETYAKQIEVVEQAFRGKGKLTPVELRKFADTYRKFRNKQADAAKAIREMDQLLREADDDVQVYGRSHDLLTRLQNDPQFRQQFEAAINRPGGEIFRDIISAKNPELEKEYTSPLTQNKYRVFLAPDRVADEKTVRDMQMLVAEIDEFLQGDVNPVERQTWETRRDYIAKHLLQPKFSQKVPILKFGSVNLNPFSVVQLVAGGRARGPRSELEKMAFRASSEANTTFRVADQALIGYNLISNNTEFGDEATKVAVLEAVASHKTPDGQPWSVDRIGFWNETVLEPILASGQAAGQMRLKEGDFIPGTGVKITKQDMEVARKQKRYSQGIVQTTQGTAKNLPGLLVDNPVLIKTTILGRKGLRGAISPGPLTMARTFSEWSKLFSQAWTKKSPEGRRSMVTDGEHFQKAVLGYVSTTNPEFNNTSQYKSVYEAFAARAKEDENYQVQSLDQLLERLAAIAVEKKLFQSVAEATPKIEEALLSEIGEHVTAIQKHFADEGITDDTPQTVIQYASAKSAFTTARKNMLAPDPYYQYTLTHGSDRLGFVAAGYQQFQLRQIDALKALKAALDRKEAEFAEEIGRLKHKGMSARKAEATVQKKSETQLDRTRFSMVNLHDHKRVIEKVLKDLTENVIDVRDPNDSIALTALQRVTKNLSSSLLSSPAALANNFFGGIAANSVILRNLGRAHIVWTPLKSTAHTTGALVKKVLLTFASTTAIGKVAHSKANLPIIKDMALMVDNLLRGWTQQYLEMQERGLVAPTDMRNRLRAQAALKTSAGAIERGRPPLIAAIPNWLESLPGMRQFLGHLRDKVPRIGDEIVNMGAAGVQTSEVFDFLKLRAEKAFEGREAAGDDINAPNYFANEQNLLSPKELGLVESTGYRDADSLRQMFEIVGNLDGFLLNYYNRLKQVPEGQKHTVPLFENPADEGAVLYDMNAHGNIPTAGFTPPSMAGVGQRGLIKKMLFMFQNYVLRQAAQAERLADKDLRDPKGWREAYALYGILATLIIWALAGMLATETGVPATKLITGRSPSRVTAANVIADPDAAMLARYVGMALGNNLPYYGQVISQMLGNPGYGSKWDAANLIPIAGLVRDVNTAITRIGQTGDPVFPAVDFLSRWLPPVSPVLRLLPGVEGDIERRNAERALRVVGPSAGMELAGGGGGQSAQTPASAAVRRLISAAYRGDAQGIQSAFDEAVREKTEAGSADPERAVLQSLSSAVPARRVFGKSITPAEEAQMKGRMSGGQLSNYAEAQNAFDLINQTLGTSLSLTSTPRARSTTRGPATRRALFTDSATPIFARSRSRRRRLGGRRRSAFRRLQIRGSSRRRRRSPARFSFAA